AGPCFSRCLWFLCCCCCCGYGARRCGLSSALEGMTFFSVVPFAAAILALLLAVASVLRKKHSLATWLFFEGMALLSIDSLLSALIFSVSGPSELLRCLTLGLIVKSFATVAWLGFSLTYSRRDYRESLARLSAPLAAIALLPIVLSLGFRGELLQL